MHTCGLQCIHHLVITRRHPPHPAVPARRWVAVPWQFFKFNLLAGASAQYGGHPWHWNLTQGLPVVAASLLPLLGAGLMWSGASW